ncbi:hypothetical protein CHUAL_011367 [Chamberlinius hualienensis]
MENSIEISTLAMYRNTNYVSTYNSSHETQLAEFKTEVDNRPLKVNGQTDKDGYLTPKCGEKSKCQLYTITQPPKVLNASGIIIYKCKFNWKVDCFWKYNGMTISIYYSKFSYITGTGWNTKDCSISTSDIETATKYQNKPCIGIPTTFQDITVSENTVKLNCTSQGSIICSWKRNKQTVEIESRYEYIGSHNGINVNDCSITINNIAYIDEGEWICQPKVNDMTYDYWIIKAAYNLKVSTKETTSHKITTAITSLQVPLTITSHKPIISTTSFDSTTESLSTEKITTTYLPSSDGFKNHLSLYLPVICILTGIIIGMVIYVRKQQINLRNLKNSHETHLAEFKTEVNRLLKVNGQTETDGYLTQIALPTNIVKSMAGYLIPNCIKESDEFKHHLYEKLNFNIKSSN